MKHGTEKNRRLETLSEGPLAGGFAYASHEATVSERWCEQCQKWIRCDNIIYHIICRECKTKWEGE